MADQNEQDEIGYGKPPKKNRFVKGQSGNPSGRRKGAKNLSTLLNEACREKVTVSRNGRKVRMTKVEASLHQLVNKATSGDLKAIRDLLYWSKTLNEAVQDLPESSLDENDRLVAAGILKRLRQAGLEEPSSEGIEDEKEGDEKE